jgi:hypothetical protein
VLQRVLAGLALAGAVLAASVASSSPSPSVIAFTHYPLPAALAHNGNASPIKVEPSIGVNWKTGSIFLQGVLETDRLRFNNKGPVWEDVSSSTTSSVTLDAVMVSDNATGRIFVSQLVAATSLLAYSDNDGQTWSAALIGSGLPAGFDRQSIGVGPHPPSGSARPTGAYPHAVYYCAQQNVTAFCARSDNGGTFFGPSVPAYTFLDCGNLHGHMRVAPDGTVYLPNAQCQGSHGVSVSTDAGQTWTVRKVPGTTIGRTGQPGVGVGSDGTAYIGLTDGDGKPKVAVSRDRGATWTTPVDVGKQVGVVNAVFPTVIAGDGDRAAFAFLGTKTPGDSQVADFGMDASGTRYTGAEYHLYVATTFDRGRTWRTQDLTPNDPVQRGRVCLGGTACTDKDRNLLDFIDLQVDRNGRILVGWADGCTGACVRSTAVAQNSYTAHGNVSRQMTGPGLFARPAPTR